VPRRQATAEAMKTLEHPNSFHLAAAQGWLDLGDLASANDELDKIPLKLRAHPDVLLMRCEIYAKAEKWDFVLTFAERLVDIVPKEPQGWIQRSFALHELNRTQEAFDLLLAAAKTFPHDWYVPYNLACYCTQLRRLPEARQWLENAFKLGNSRKIKLMALKDPDLKPIWTNITKS